MSIYLSNVFYKYKRNEFALSIEELNIPTGSITALIGPNGSGKTTLLSLIAGLKIPQQGEININGLTYDKNKNSIYKILFCSIQNAGFYNNLSAFDNLRILCYYRNIPIDKIGSTLKLVLLQNDKKKYKYFSEGMKQKLNFAAALLSDAKIIILDEPFNGLDPGSVLFFKETINKLNKTNNMTFLISTHMLKEADSFASNFFVMNDGQVVENQLYDTKLQNIEELYISLMKANKLRAM